jgi:hypothetical protein
MSAKSITFQSWYWKVGVLVLLSLLAFPLRSWPQTEPPAGTIYAQQLIDTTLAKHPDIVVMAFHVIPPGQTENVIIASNIGRIGKKADEDDLRVIQTGKSNLEVNKAGDRFEDELPLLDRSGKIIGAVGIVFLYKAGDDKEKLVAIAQRVRNEMQRQIPSREKLFEAASK